MNTENKKPFGLTLASKIAANAITQSVAPLSTILFNLVSLQKDTNFPKDLDVTYFSTQRNNSSEENKKLVVKMIEQLKSPHLNKAELLENTIKDGWVKKKAPAPLAKNPLPPKKTVTKKFKPKNKQKVVAQKEITTPVVIVKKSRKTI